ncbi:hypothetical protein B0H14DRAFT_3477556 [Mycena olivaceomarginata]|nr:hypothetical protein B0H14DRAFT_3477556 [Mycena olivaceomarginata]
MCRYFLHAASIQGASHHPSPTVISTRAQDVAPKTSSPPSPPSAASPFSRTSSAAHRDGVPCARRAQRADGRGARLSGYLHVTTRAESALSQRSALLPSLAVRSVLGAWTWSCSVPVASSRRGPPVSLMHAFLVDYPAHRRLVWRDAYDTCSAIRHRLHAAGNSVAALRDGGSRGRDQQRLNGSSRWILVDIIVLPHFGFDLTQHPPSPRTSFSVLVRDGLSSYLDPKLEPET